MNIFYKVRESLAGPEPPKDNSLVETKYPLCGLICIPLTNFNKYKFK